MEVKSILEKVKEMVKKGNVSKIVLSRKEEVLVSIPVNVGVVGVVVGLTAAKWAVLAAALATVGFGCKLEVVKDDGEVVNIMTEEDTQKAKDTAAGLVEQAKEVAEKMVEKIKNKPDEEVQDADFETVVDDSEPKE